MRALVPVSLVVLLGLASKAARAETAHPVDAATSKRAGDLFHAGRVAAEAGDDKTACARFTESEALQPAPGTQLNLGACEAKQGHLLAAREHFRKAGGGFKPDDRRRAIAINSANDVSDRLAVVTVHVAPGAPPDAKVLLQDAPLDATVLEKGVEVDPGKTELVVTAAGREPKTYDLDPKEGEKRELTVDAGDPVVVATASPPPAPVVAESPAEPSSRRSLEHTLGYVGAGTGGLGLILGGVFGGLAFHEASVVKANCSPTYACNQTGLGAAASGSTDGVVSTAMFITGGVLAAAGAYLLVTTWGDADAGHPATGSLVLRPVFGPSGGGAMGSWSF